MTRGAMVKFLEARISEDEAVARGAEPGPWYVDDEEQTVRAREYAGEIMFDRSGYGRAVWVRTDSLSAGHIARYDPARVLAECAAKRAVIPYSPPKTLQHLAAVYADHPDYRQEWA